MRAQSTIARGTRHIVGVGLQAVLLAAIVATVALAMSAFYKPAGFVAGVEPVLAGRFTATITFADASERAATSTAAVSGDVLFAITQSATSDNVMWVTNRCFDATGAEVSRLDLPVRWGTWASLEGLAGPFETAGLGCTAYATWKPWTNRAIGGAVMEYSVSN